MHSTAKAACGLTTGGFNDILFYFQPKYSAIIMKNFGRDMILLAVMIMVTIPRGPNLWLLPLFTLLFHILRH
jgi:hypothetical protein